MISFEFHTQNWNLMLTSYSLQEMSTLFRKSHILWCPFYASLREGKSLDDDLDLVNYFRAVFRIREDKQS